MGPMWNSHRSLGIFRRAKHGIPKTVVSSWIPPESLKINFASDINLRNSKYPSGLSKKIWAFSLSVYWNQIHWDASYFWDESETPQQFLLNLPERIESFQKIFLAVNVTRTVQSQKGKILGAVNSDRGLFSNSVRAQGCPKVNQSSHWRRQALIQAF